MRKIIYKIRFLTRLLYYLRRLLFVLAVALCFSTATAQVVFAVEVSEDFSEEQETTEIDINVSDDDDVEQEITENDSNVSDDDVEQEITENDSNVSDDDDVEQETTETDINVSDEASRETNFDNKGDEYNVFLGDYFSNVLVQLTSVSDEIGQIVPIINAERNNINEPYLSYIRGVAMQRGITQHYVAYVTTQYTNSTTYYIYNIAVGNLYWSGSRFDCDGTVSLTSFRSDGTVTRATSSNWYLVPSSYIVLTDLGQGYPDITAQYSGSYYLFFLASISVMFYSFTVIFGKVKNYRRRKSRRVI